MAKITCAISGISFTCTFLKDTSISELAGYYHPIFALDYTTLHRLYSEHTKGNLGRTDSYLLFLAFLHSTDCITWSRPANKAPSNLDTIKLVENNIAQLIAVIEKSNTIRHPSFSQPHYRVTEASCNLSAIPNWIAEWDSNIQDFLHDKADQADWEKIKKVENKLSKLILSGGNPRDFSAVIAEWANNTADFPTHKAEAFKKIIRSCFNTAKMFNTPLAEIREVKEFCEANIEAGSIHFHTLEEVLTEGLARHTNYLGGSNLALGYTMLPTLDSSKPDIEYDYTTTGKNSSDGKVYLPEVAAEIKNLDAIKAVADSAPESYPLEKDYETSLDYLRAKLAYRVKKNL